MKTRPLNRKLRTVLTSLVLALAAFPAVLSADSQSLNFPQIATIEVNTCATTWLTVSGLSGATTDVTQLLNLNHDTDLYVDIYLQAPTGEILELSSGNGDADSNYTDTLFSDAGAVSITAGSAPFNGTFRPEGSLTASGAPCNLTPTVSNFFDLMAGLEPNGVWTLYIGNSSGYWTGTLVMGNTLTIQTSPHVPPTASGVIISGTLSERGVLTGSYTYTDPNGQPESGSTYRWRRADDNSGANAADISGATANPYTAVAADIGRYLSFCVTPSDDYRIGSEVCSAWSGPVASNQPPTASNVTFSGIFVESFVLNGSYSYSDPENNPESSTYRWRRADDNAGANAADIGNTTNYTVVSADVEKYLSFCVTPSDGLDTGSEVCSIWGFVFPDLAALEATTLAAGHSHTCVVTESGTVKCWGYNSNGQLGDGTTTNRSTPVSVSGLSGVMSITAGERHTCALTYAGEVRCWGRNAYGQLGNGSTSNRSVPVAVSGLSDVRAIAAGMDHTCALTNAGEVKCWGNNNYYQLGNNSIEEASGWKSTVPVSVPGLSNIKAITAGDNHTCALTNDGSARCWGDYFGGQLGGIYYPDIGEKWVDPYLSGGTAITAGQSHTCALTNDSGVSGVKCWGDNTHSQIGSINNTTIWSPTAVSGMMGASMIEAGVSHTCVQFFNGEAKCWGRNNAGQLGDGSTDNSGEPVLVSGLSGVTAITAGGYHSCAMIAAGRVKCWGRNTYGQLGDGTTGDSLAPVVVIGVGGKPVAGSVGISGTLLEGQTLTGSYAYSDPENDPESGTTYRWVRADDGQGTNAADVGSALNYAVLAADVGLYLSFCVTPSDGIATGFEVCSAWVGPIAANQPPAAADVGLGLGGALREGETLNGNYSYSDPENDPESGSTFRWLRADDNAGANAAEISGATATATDYTVAAADVGYYLRFCVTPADMFGPGSEACSGWGRVDIPPSAADVGIGGISAEGETLSGIYVYHDEDNDPESGSTYRWRQADDAVGAGATDIADTVAYTVVSADAGKYLAFCVTPANTISFGSEVCSSWGRVDIPPSAADVGIGGISAEGETLSGIYVYHDEDNDPESGSTYRWRQADDAVGAGATDIADTVAHTVVSADAGKYLAFCVTPANTISFGSEVCSSWSGPVSVTVSPGHVFTNLELWLKADVGIGESDGQNVTDWTDQPPNGYTTGNGGSGGQTSPTFRNNSTDNLNFNPVVEFDGVNNGVDLAGDYIYSANDGLTILAAVKTDDAANTSNFVFDFGAFGNAGYGLHYGNDTSGLYTASGFGGASADFAHSYGTAPVIVSGKIAFGADQRLYINGGLAGSQAITLTQLSVAEIDASPTHAFSAGPATIGSQSKTHNSGSRKFDGKIAEVLVYAADLSDNDRTKAQSYLAVKYGITLASDYLASDGAVLWASGGAYHNDIAGIGRDDNSGLSQLKSRSVNSDSIVIIEHGGGADLSFLLWGNDNGAVTNSALELPGGSTLAYRLAREWKVTNTNGVGPVTVTADMSALSLTGSYSVLLVDTDNDGDFTTGTPTEYSAASYVAGVAVFNDVALADGNVFTLARAQQTPPTASNVGVSGTLVTGYILNGAYVYSDSDNDPESGAILRWLRADDDQGANAASISGATATAYTVVSADVGKYLAFCVTPNDGIDAGAEVCSPWIYNQAPDATGVNIGGTVAAGHTLSGSYSYSDPENDPESGSIYRWVHADDDQGTNAANVGGALNYPVVAADVGLYLAFCVTPGDGTNTGLEVCSAWAGPITANQAPAATAVSLSGALREGEILSGGYSYSDAESDPESGTVLRWVLADDDKGTNAADVGGALNYTVLAADAGKYLAFCVTPGDGIDTGLEACSAWAGPIAANQAPVATAVTLGGTLREGEILSGSYSYSDPENDPESGTAFRWLRADDNAGGNAANISGATTTAYTTATADIGQYLSFCVTPSDGIDTGTETCSAWSGPVTAIPVAGFDQAVHFPSGQSLLVPNHADLNLTNNFTIELWVKPGDVIGTYTFLLYKHDLGASGYLLMLQQKHLRLALNESTCGTDTGNPLVPGVWTHVAASLDDTGLVSFYINGVQTEVVDCGVTAVDLSVISEYNEHLSFGNSNTEITLDEVRIWNIVRSPEEIRQAAAIGIDPATTGLLGYWRFDEVIGTAVAADATGHGHDAAFTYANPFTHRVDVNGEVPLHTTVRNNDTTTALLPADADDNQALTWALADTSGCAGIADIALLDATTGAFSAVRNGGADGQACSFSYQVTGAVASNVQSVGLSVELCSAYTYPYTLGTVQSDLLLDLRQAVACANQNGTADTIDLGGQTVTASTGTLNRGYNLLVTTDTLTLQNGTLERDAGLTTCTAQDYADFRIIYALADLTVSNMTLRNGCASDSSGSGFDTYGGGIYADGAAVRVLNTHFEGNRSTAHSAAIQMRNGIASVINSSFTDNSGNGILSFSDAGSVIVNSTITGSSGGSTVLSGVAPTIYNSTLADNAIPAVDAATLYNTVLANNTGSNCTGAVTGSHNYSDDSSCGFSANNGADNAVILLGALTQAGNATYYYPLSGGDPLDGGDNALLPNESTLGLDIDDDGLSDDPIDVDQRGAGFPRIVNAIVDAGAYEMTNTPPTATDVAITGTLTEGQTLTGGYSYSDPESDPESGSVYRWQRADDNSGANAADISGANATVWTVAAEDVGKYLSFCVTPSDGLGYGSEVCSDWQGAISLPSYSVTPVAGPGGTLDPATQQSVAHGETASLILVPEVGYSIESVTGCGGSLIGDTYTTGPITGDCSVSAHFTLNSYSVTPIAGAGGSLSPAGVQSVFHGSTASFTVIPDVGYSIVGVSGCGGLLSAGSYTTAATTGACTVTATFSLNRYDITTGADPVKGGSVICSPNPVEHGGSSSCTATANVGYLFDRWGGDCFGGSCELVAVEGALDVIAWFQEDLSIAVSCSPVPEIVLPPAHQWDEVIESETTLETDSVVIVGAGMRVSYVAGESVTLHPGFHAESGSHFQAIVRDISCASN